MNFLKPLKKLYQFGKTRTSPPNNYALVNQHFNTAVQLMEWGEYSSATTIIKDCINLAPSAAPLHFHLGEALRKQNKYSEAQTALLEYLKLDPDDNLGASIKLGLMGFKPHHEAMTLTYVRTLFDQFAPHFEASLIGNLNYKTPQEIGSIVLMESPGPFDRILDLGCGTGLSALPFRDEASWIEGIDISAGMIAQAREKNIFNDLHVTDIKTFLENEKSQYDLIISSDVFIYLPDLANIFTLVSNRLSPNGLFSFSVQATDCLDKDFLLGEDHRYSHKEQYVLNSIKASNMRMMKNTHTTLRHEQNIATKGNIFLCKKNLA